MQIKASRIYLRRAAPKSRSIRNTRGTMEKVPPGLNGLFTHSNGFRAQRPDEVIEYADDTLYPTFHAQLRLLTDGPLDAYCGFANSFHQDDLEFEARRFQADIAPMLIGVDAFDREYIWQRLWYAQRFFYTGRGVVDKVDNMLWNLASRHARQPLCKLLGACRDRVPAYRGIHGNTIDELVADALKAREQGFKGCKDHSFRGVKGNTELFTELRAALGDDFLLMHDPVGHYTYTEAVKIGRVLEKLNCRWIEEPLQDYDLMGSRSCAPPWTCRLWRWSGSATSAASPSTPRPFWPSRPPTSPATGASASPARSNRSSCAKVSAFNATAATTTSSWPPATTRWWRRGATSVPCPPMWRSLFRAVPTWKTAA